MTYVGKKPADIIATAVDTTTGTFSGDLTVDTNTLYVDSTNNRVGLGTSSPGQLLHLSSSDPRINIEDTDAGGIFQIRNTIGIGYVGTLGTHPMVFYTNGVQRIKLDSDGDINFYEDTGTTPKLFWDASEERLGIGTASPSTSLHIHQSQPIIQITDTDTTASHQLTGQSGARNFNLKVDTGGTTGSPKYNISIQDDNKFTITNDGAIGINNSDPISYANSQAVLFVGDNINPAIAISDTGQSKDYFIVASGSNLRINYADGGGSGGATNITELIKMDNSGEVTMPNQPAFYAVQGVEQSNIATGQWHTITFGGTVRFDQNADFNNSTGVFTAPVTGKYQFNTSVRLTNADTSAGAYLFRINGSNRSPIANYDANQYATDTEITVQLSSLLDMDAGDTAKVQVYQDTGTAQTDIQNGEYTFFNGFLAC